jgi:tRNA C32,U32 (ribose-2'-O)-methylase TrmJ
MVFAFSVYKLTRHCEIASALSGALPRNDFVSKKEVQEVLVALRLALQALGYDSARGLLERVTKSFHRLLKRSNLLESEARMFKGLTRRIVQKLKD